MEFTAQDLRLVEQLRSDDPRYIQSWIRKFDQQNGIEPEVRNSEPSCDPRGPASLNRPDRPGAPHTIDYCKSEADPEHQHEITTTPGAATDGGPRYCGNTGYGDHVSSHRPAGMQGQVARC